MKRAFFLGSVLAFCSSTVLADSLLEGFEYTKSQLGSHMTVEEFSEISRSLKGLFNSGNVTEFNFKRRSYKRFPVDLRGVKCNNRSLEGIDLSNAILSLSDFRGCNLQGAIFQNSYLSDAEFSSFSLFGETNIFDTDFTNAIFQRQENLEKEITHIFGRTKYIWDDSMSSWPRKSAYRASFRSTDLSKSKGLDVLKIDSLGSRAMTLANSDKIFTGTYDDSSDTFQSVENDLLELSPSNNFLSYLEPHVRKRFEGKKAWVLFGEFYGSKGFDVINTNPDVVIILNGFSVHGYIKTKGDVIVCGKRGHGEIGAKGVIHYCQ